MGDSLICGRCFARTKGLLEGVPDMLAHIRAQIDPLRATVYDKEPGGGGARTHAPPPVPVELLDAADYIVTLLWSSQEVVQGRMPHGSMQVPVSAGVAVLHDFASAAVAEILAGLGDLSKREEIVPLADAVIGRPASRDEWTLRTVFERWSLREEPWWAAQPCPVPACGLRAVKVTPPELPGDETRYECVKCGWLAPADDDGFWAECFSRREGKAA
ncbi:hypothetical protein [Microbacterium sp. MMO-10]|uniref:hypothetical protein n=1 Tax=Microbacterium sp. MMO-10 TaxID=3081272 RepID=UPI00301A0DB6